jgi:Domain of unknown function (DUF4331)
MSHHFDTPTARQDPRINLCDFYLFRGVPGSTVMAMTVNPDAGLSAPDTFREEGLYAFRFDLNNDAREEVTFKVRFGPVSHADGGGHQHVQTFEVRRAVGEAALSGEHGEIIASGRTDQSLKTDQGISFFAGLSPDLFAGDGAALGIFRTAHNEGRFAPEAFQNRKNYFNNRNVTAIVLEVPSTLIGHGKVHGWATVSLVGHAPEAQVSRWGLPHITNIFMLDMDIREAYNRSTPTDDPAHFSGEIAQFSERLTTQSESVSSPPRYAKQLVERLCPTTLPYVLDTEAAFNFLGFNGRALTDDVMDVILTLASNTPLGDGVAPDLNRVRKDFPYFGLPYTPAEQSSVAPHFVSGKK